LLQNNHGLTRNEKRPEYGFHVVDPQKQHQKKRIDVAVPKASTAGELESKTRIENQDFHLLL